MAARKMSQVFSHVCAGFQRGKGSLCANCGHPVEKHVDSPLNSAGHCRECVKLWRASQERARRVALAY